MARTKSPKKNVDPNDAVAAVATPEKSMAAAASLGAAAVAKMVTSRKAEAVRAESRVTLVPINLDDEIRQLAYLISERRGFEPGHETEDWLAAEHEVLQRYNRQSA